jgi:hypothetical protein
LSEIVNPAETAKRVGERAWRDLLHRVHTVAHQQLSLAGAQELDTAETTGLLAIFDNQENAIATAFEIKSSFEKYRLKVRVLVHSSATALTIPKARALAAVLKIRVFSGDTDSEVLFSSLDQHAIAHERMTMTATRQLDLKELESPVYVSTLNVSAESSF